MALHLHLATPTDALKWPLLIHFSFCSGFAALLDSNRKFASTSQTNSKSKNAYKPQTYQHAKAAERTTGQFAGTASRPLHTNLTSMILGLQTRVQRLARLPTRSKYVIYSEGIGKF